MFQANYRLLDGTCGLLTELREAGADLHLFSNYPHWYQRHRGQAVSPVAWHRGVLCPVTSASASPARRFFQHVFQQLQAKAE